MGMKRRYLAVLMGIMVATTSVPAMVYAEDSKTETAADAANDESGEADASDENGDESQENVVLGEVKSVSDSEITIAVGTMKEMGQPGGDGQNGGAPDGNGQGGEAPSMLDLTGEEQTITITADTVITKQAGGMQPGGDGQNDDRQHDHCRRIDTVSEMLALEFALHRLASSQHPLHRRDSIDWIVRNRNSPISVTK